ncbi:transglycosylase [Cupriavidus necator N-1]|uniref:Transglycosylase n=1 Tax=Cupriavidus necator (strain ATCC 43291 / DSM 13513 / CCUG 52238 / LMG 8453 / N-1) TaxID=1042878 RepID=G0EZ24_CUPNN|nr:lytic transglycosylase domain-containing protein [Cupriavidus necator]AEI76289.1 transglycosylase [Cupriavidus necator N-1]MDX6011587.1 lytic transglycosylase domain-containing protein [Cupriavidus necator]
MPALVAAPARGVVAAMLLAGAVPAGAEIVMHADRGSGVTFLTSRSAGTAEVAPTAAPAALPARAFIGLPTQPVAKAAVVAGKSPPSELVALAHRAAQAAAVDPHLLMAMVEVESGWNPQATSVKGAIGLRQLMPATARMLGVTDAYDPAQNLQGGASYLGGLLSRFNGDTSLALAAYNAGEGAVLRHGSRIPPFAETQAYVPQVLGRYARLRSGQDDSAAAPLRQPAAPAQRSGLVIVSFQKTPASVVKKKEKS